MECPHILTMDMIKDGQVFLYNKIRRTPVEESRDLSEILGVPVWLKLECFQITGSFKVRGALFRLAQLSPTEKKVGIATCSAGNHGKSIAYAAQRIGVQVTIYVPNSIDLCKFQGMVVMGAKVIRSPFEGYDDTEEWAREQIAKSGQLFISGFDDPYIMAGNGGSIAAEILEDVPEARTFIVPVGGGGHAAGFTYYAKKKLSDSLIIACQHKLSPALKLSIELNKAVTRLQAVTTLAAGLEGGIGRLTFDILKTRIDRVALATEKEIRSAVIWMLEHHQYLIEPTAAVTVAACLNGQIGRLTSPTVIMLSGRNVDVQTVKKLLCS